MAGLVGATSDFLISPDDGADLTSLDEINGETKIHTISDLRYTNG